MRFNLIDLYSNLVPVKACKIQGDRCFSIPLTRSALCVPRMQCTICCFAASQCSSTSLLSANVGLQLILSQGIALQNVPSPSCLHSSTAICSPCRAPRVCLLQTHHASCLNDEINRCCVCRRPFSQVLTPPAVAIATASVSDSFM